MLTTDVSVGSAVVETGSEAASVAGGSSEVGSADVGSADVGSEASVGWVVVSGTSDDGKALLTMLARGAFQGTEEHVRAQRFSAVDSFSKTCSSEALQVSREQSRTPNLNSSLWHKQALSVAEPHWNLVK